MHNALVHTENTILSNTFNKFSSVRKCKATGKTFASMNPKEKNLYSHRALALKKLVTYLRVTGKISCHNLPKHEHR